MSNNVKLQVLLRAVDQASRPFKSIRTASKSLSGDIRETQKSLRELNGHASRIEGFRKTSAQLAVTGHALEKARQEAEALATQFKNTERPTRAQAKVLESAKRAAEDLQAKYNRLTDSVKRQQRELAAVGINTRNLAHDEQGLKNRISETTAQLNRQRDALARVSAQQAKLNAVKQRYQVGKELAGNMASVGAAGVGIAAAGTMAGVKLLMPGYEFAQKNSELQAVLGVAKDSAEMAALRKQARQLGDNTAASADDAAGAQIIIAKAGGDVDAIQAATPVTLNMALANRRTMEENAALLMGMKSAFQLSNDKVAHIGDVLSMTMNKTAADFDGMSDALTYAAPVAKNAGVSIEETAAMVGALHDAKITGSMAGTGSRAVLSRLQAPTGKAWDALKELGVKTSDSKGNTVDEVEHRGAPDVVTIRARSADFRGTLNSRREGSWHDTTLGAIVEAIASRNRLEASVAPSLAGIKIPHIDQSQESDAKFLTRLAERNGGEVSVKMGKLLFLKAGQGVTASGKKIQQVTITRSDGDRHHFAIADRGAYTGVTAKWLHTKDPKPQKQKVKLKRKKKEKHLRALEHPKAKPVRQKKAPKVPEAREGEYMAGEADNVFALTTVYATKAQAMRAAQAKWDKLQRGVAEFSISLATGRADIYTETPVKVSGFKRVIDEQDWTITKVTHFLNNSGFTTSLELEVRLSDVEYETEDDE